MRPIRYRKVPRYSSPNRRPYRPKEKDICKSFYHQYLIRQHFNQIRNDILIFHIANEQNTNIYYTMELKKMGLLAGVFDYPILIKGGGIAFLEFKRDEKCKLTPAQIKFGELLDWLGIKWKVVYSVEQAFEFIEGL